MTEDKSAESINSLSTSTWVVRTAVAAASLTVAVGLLASLWFLRRPLAIFFLGLALACALAPLAAWGERWLPRRLTIILIYLLLALILIGVGAVVFPRLADQAQRLVERIPSYTARARNWLQGNLGFPEGLPIEQLLSGITGVASTLASLPVRISSSLLDTLLVAFISLYSLLLAPSARETLLSLIPEEDHPGTDELLHRLVNAVGGYFQGVVISGLIGGVATFLALVVIGVEFALISALIVTVAEFIPFLGPLISGVIIVVITFLQSPGKALIVLAFAVALHQLEGNFIVPQVMGTQAGISPLATLVVIFAGWSVGGVLGALVAIPLYALVQVLVTDLVFPMIRH